MPSYNNKQTASGFVTFASGDAGTSQDFLTINDEQTFAPNRFHFSYANGGTNEIDIELWDAPEGTAQGDLSSDGKQLAVFQFSPGDFENFEFELEEVENDLVAVVNSNDDDVSLNVVGKLVT